jgi:hypothetical protein
VEQTYGPDVLNLVVSIGYLAKLLENGAARQYVAQPPSGPGDGARINHCNEFSGPAAIQRGLLTPGREFSAQSKTSKGMGARRCQVALTARLNSDVAADI